MRATHAKWQNADYNLTTVMSRENSEPTYVRPATWNIDGGNGDGLQSWRAYNIQRAFGQIINRMLDKFPDLIERKNGKLYPKNQGTLK